MRRELVRQRPAERDRRAAEKKPESSCRWWYHSWPVASQRRCGKKLRSIGLVSNHQSTSPVMKEMYVFTDPKPNAYDIPWLGIIIDDKRTSFRLARCTGPRLSSRLCICTTEDATCGKVRQGINAKVRTLLGYANPWTSI